MNKPKFILFNALIHSSYYVRLEKIRHFLVRWYFWPVRGCLRCQKFFYLDLLKNRVGKYRHLARLLQIFQRIAGTRSFFLRNEAGTDDASKIRGTGKGTVRSFPVPLASIFDEKFGEILQISRNHPQYLYFTVYRMKNDAYLKNWLI